MVPDKTIPETQEVPIARTEPESQAAGASMRTYGVPLQRGPRLKLPQHRNAPDESNLASVRRWVRAQNGLTAVDVFCGAGGLSLGLADAGFKVIVGADSDPRSIETHRANLGGLTYLGDLKDPSRFIAQLAEWGIRRVDLVAGGVPCQPFSRAGRSKITSLVSSGVRVAADDRVALWGSFIEIVKALKPRAVLFENVPDLAEWEGGSILARLCDSLFSLGYGVDARILNAFDHGVPQHRVRLFVVGLRSGSRFKWPRPSRQPDINVAGAIRDLPKAPPNQREERIPYRGPKTWLQRRLRRRMRSADRAFVYDHITRAVRADDAEAFALLEEGKTYETLPARLQRYRTDAFSDKYNRLTWSGLSRSITAHIAKDGYWYIHPQQDRTLSIREAARLQTFPDWFRFAGEPSHRYRQIGNAVPPLLAEAIAKSLRTALAGVGRHRKPTLTLRSKLLRWRGAGGVSYPWHRGVSPWHVLMGEICLRHAPRSLDRSEVYAELCHLAPTPLAVVRNQAAVKRLLFRSGLKSRCSPLLRVAGSLVRFRAGVVPEERDDLVRLPGVGSQAAAAVRVYGYGRREVLLDAGAARVISRLHGHPGSVRRWQLRIDLYQLAGPSGPDIAFNASLQHLAASVCTQDRPRCTSCPLKGTCASYASRSSL
jgi:DNA (cytosine-5)-methyltransferase 1